MAKAVTKADLVDTVVTKVGGRLTKREATETVDAVIEAITNALTDGSKVQITGFGSFDVRARKARVGRNPADPSKTIDIPAQNAPVFKAGKRLKEAVN